MNLMKQSARSLLAALVLAGGVSVFGCTSKPPAPSPSPPAPKPSATAAATPSAAPASPAAASPAAASPAAASPKAASPSAASPAAGKETAPQPVGFKRVEYEDAGVGFSVPDTFPKWEKIEGDWLFSCTPDKKLIVCVRSKEWKEWSEIEKACDDLMTDWKASEEKVQEAKTTDGIKFYYDYGTATILKKKYAVLVAGYELSDHDFVMVVAGDPDAKDFVANATKIYSSVTRQAKYQDTEDKKGDE